MFSLRFERSSILEFAGRYPAGDDHEAEIVIAPQVRARGYFTKSEFQILCRWKTARSKPLIESNPDDFIEAVTRTALSTLNERLRIEVLMLLKGVSWPTASVLLHFGCLDLYPILDFRALWSLGIDSETTEYDFEFWWQYTQFCRELAKEADVTMRTFDRALWEYSKEKQKR